MTRTLRAFVVVAAATAVFGAGSAAVAGVDVSDVASSLRANPLYVDPAAERALTTVQADDVRGAIRSAGTPIYLAVLPSTAADAAGGDASQLVPQLAQAVDRPGTYGVVVGDAFRVGSSELPEGRAAELADEALDAGGQDTTAVLVDFVQRVGAEANDAGGGGGGTRGEDDDGDGTNVVLPLLLLGVGGLVVYMALRGRRRRSAEEAERARAQQADRQMLRAEVSVLADDVVSLEPQVDLHPAARPDFDAAVSRYRAAQAALEYADQPIDTVRVARVVDEARYLMDRVRALVAGREPPDPPEHLRHRGEHGEPAIDLDENRQPMYVGYPGGFGTGWFGGAGSLFGGLLLGSALFGGFGPFGWGYGGTTIINEGGGGGDDWGSGDFGGGDFGGGDFGGGDFGGGDF